MPHAVESMFYVREVPWHGLGTRVDEAPDSEKALILAGLDWAVEQEPVFVQGKVVEGYLANVRATDRRVLGIVGEDYRVFQNREAFAFTDALLGLGVRYETAGSLYGGRRVWILARLREPLDLLGDEVAPYLCITNSHDGAGAIRAVVTPVRVVCQNTLNLALQKAQRSWATRHSGYVSSRLSQAAETLHLTHQYLASLQEQADLLQQVRVTDDDWRGLLNHLYPIPARPKPQQYSHTWKRTVTLRMRQQEDLNRCYWAHDLRRFRHSTWAVVNALIDYTDHIRFQPSERSFTRILDEGRPDLEKALKYLKVQLRASSLPRPE